MTRSRLIAVISSVLIFLLMVILPASLSAEEVIDEEFGYFLDFPEGFQVAENTPDGMSYRFVHEKFPVSLILKLYPDNSFSKPDEALNGTLSMLNAEYDTDTFSWRNTDCAVTQFTMTLPGTKKSKGWGTAVTLPEKNAELVLLCYSDEDKEAALEPFILSTLNSLGIDSGSRTESGIIVSYAWPETEKKTVNVKIAGKNIKTTFDKEDAEANNFLIGMEWNVFTLYVKEKNWEEAWKRFYRNVFRDTYGRFKKAAFDLNSALEPVCLKLNPENPDIAMNELLLEWVQNFQYPEAKNLPATESGLTSPVYAFCGDESNDCDSRSILMCVLLRQMGMDTCLFISREYSHAVYGVNLPQNGAKIEVNGAEYLLGETTAKGVKPGLMAQNQSDTEKWIPVPLN